MRLEEIIRKDWHRHYQDRGVTADDMWANFKKYRDHGDAFTATDKVITLLKYVGNNTIEFHCLNGGNAKDIVEAVNLLLNKLSDKYDLAITYFDNPMVGNFVKYSNFPSWVDEVNLGQDMKYKLTVDLRSK